MKGNKSAWILMRTELEQNQCGWRPTGSSGLQQQFVHWSDGRHSAFLLCCLVLTLTSTILGELCSMNRPRTSLVPPLTLDFEFVCFLPYQILIKI